MLVEDVAAHHPHAPDPVRNADGGRRDPAALKRIRYREVQPQEARSCVDRPASPSPCCSPWPSWPLRSLRPRRVDTLKAGGTLNVMLREDLPQGFAIHETSTISTVWPAVPCFNNLVFFDPLKAHGERRTPRGRARRAVVVAGQLPEPRLFPPQGRQVARRQALHLEGRQVHLRHAARGAGRAGQAPHQSAQGLVRQRRADRGARSVHGGLPAQAAAALAADHARLRLLAGLRGARPARPVPHELHRHGPVQAQGVAPGRVRRVREEPRLLRQGPPVSRRARATSSSSSAARGRRRSRPASSTSRSRARRRRRRRNSSRRPCRRSWSHTVGAQRDRQHHHEHQEAALRQPEGAPGGEPTRSTAAASSRPCTRAARRSAPRMPPRRTASGALLDKDLLALPGYGKAADDEGPGQEAHAEAGVTPRQAAQGRDGDPRHRRSTSTWPRSSSTS